jgi:hypothetical protein
MQFEGPDNPARPWFAVRVKSRCEKIVSAMAQGEGIEEFLPLYECRRCWAGGSKTVKSPFFQVTYSAAWTHTGAMRCGRALAQYPHLTPSTYFPPFCLLPPSLHQDAPRCHLDLI